VLLNGRHRPVCRALRSPVPGLAPWLGKAIQQVGMNCPASTDFRATWSQQVAEREIAEQPRPPTPRGVAAMQAAPRRAARRRAETGNGASAWPRGVWQFQGSRESVKVSKAQAKRKEPTWRPAGVLPGSFRENPAGHWRQALPGGAVASAAFNAGCSRPGIGDEFGFPPVHAGFRPGDADLPSAAVLRLI